MSSEYHELAAYGYLPHDARLNWTEWAINDAYIKADYETRNEEIAYAYKCATVIHRACAIGFVKGKVYGKLELRVEDELREQAYLRARERAEAELELSERAKVWEESCQKKIRRT